MILFDYIFYRIAKFFYKSDGSEAIRALGFIVAIQGLLLISVFFLIQLSWGFRINIQVYSKIIGVILFIVLGVLNYLRYKGKYRTLANKWNGQETQIASLLKGILIIISIVFSLILAVFTGLLASQIGK